MKVITITGRSVLKTLGLGAIIGGILGVGGWLAISALEPASWKTAQVPTLLAVAVGYAAIPAAMLIVYGGFAGLRDRLKLRYTGLRDIWLALGVFVALMAGLTLLYMLLGIISGSLWTPGLDLIHNATDMSRFATANAVSWLLILVRVCLLAGLTEELLFRGAVFGWLRQRYAALPTILITSTLFTVEHYYLVIFPAAFLYGLVAGWLRERTGSVLPGLVVHILTDVSLLLAAYILVY